MSSFVKKNCIHQKRRKGFESGGIKFGAKRHNFFDVPLHFFVVPPHWMSLSVIYNTQYMSSLIVFIVIVEHKCSFQLSQKTYIDRGGINNKIKEIIVVTNLSVGYSIIIRPSGEHLDEVTKDVSSDLLCTNKCLSNKVQIDLVSSKTQTVKQILFWMDKSIQIFNQTNHFVRPTGYLRKCWHALFTYS